MTKMHWLPAVAFAAALLSGCEWTSTDSSESWNENYSWANFSGTYRPQRGLLVSEFRPGSAGGGDTETPLRYVVKDENDGTLAAMQTKARGSCNKHPGIVPGSVTIIMVGSNSKGTFTDQTGDGVLNGTFNLVGPDLPGDHVGTGTINYDTGVWTLDLQSPGFLEEVSITLNYVYEIAPDRPQADVDEDEAVTAGGNVYSFVVDHMGSWISIRDNNGYVYEGNMGRVTTTAGDEAGTQSGRIVANFRAQGVAAGMGVTLVGTFEGNYTYTPATIEQGTTTTQERRTLSNRIIQGTWIQNDGSTADIYGYADGVVSSTATNAP